MNKNLIIVFAGALVVAILVAFLVQVSLKDEPAPVVEKTTVDIAVAAKDLKVGHLLSAGDLVWKEWPEGSVPEDAVISEGAADPYEAVQGRLKRPVMAAQPFRRSALLGPDEGNVIAAALPEGMRAVAIEVEAATMVAGFIGPGDFVDVVLTYNIEIQVGQDDAQAQNVVSKNLDEYAAETILHNVRILAVDQTAEREGGNEASVGRTVTLAVDAEQAEKLVLAQQIGDLTLVLRAMGDDAKSDKQWPIVTDVRMTRIGGEIFEEINKMRNDTGIRGHSVRIYNGDQLQRTPSQ